MRRALTVILAICVIAVALPSWGNSAELANGIYQVVKTGMGTPVTRMSGGKIDLGKRVSSNFGDITCWSLSNQNDLFRLSSYGAGPFDRNQKTAIYVDGVCEVVSTNSPQQDKPKGVHYITIVYGQANSVKLANALEVKIRERHHPGHKLLVR